MDPCMFVAPWQGRIKVEPHDFIVEELPLYTPCGEGEHLYMWVEKNDLSAEQMFKHISRVLSIPSRDIGCAGLKDRRAVTRQWISVPVRCESHVAKLETDRFKIHKLIRHKNKLRVGHLRGNIFQITIRDVQLVRAHPSQASPCKEEPSGAVDSMTECNRIQGKRTELEDWLTQRVHEIAQFGFPNFYGEQRFGHDGSNLKLVEKLQAGDSSLWKTWRRRRPFLYKLALAAAQAKLFNQYLLFRMQRGTWNHVQLGDVLQVIGSGGLFWCDSPQREQQRYAAHEIVITGPLFGERMKAPRDEPLVWEQQVLQWSGISQDFLAALPGGRRALTVYPRNLQTSVVTSHDHHLSVLLVVELPPGSYATVLLRQLFHLRDPDEATRSAALTS